MEKLLSIVEDTFHIIGRGVLFVPGINPEATEYIRIGSPIMLKRPDGSKLQCNVTGLSFIAGGLPADDTGILLGGLTKEDIPIGTEVWSTDSPAEATYSSKKESTR
jgi:hypothetical protein